MVSSLKKQKKFGLVWEDKPEKVATDCEQKLPVVKEVAEKAINKAGDSEPTNIIIEGDNYHALSVLNYTHAGKIDVIYIDPPYNTGNKDFVYNDRYIDNTDAFRHSKWLSFMQKRLKLAKNLLKPTGLIFISIDNNEKAYLKLLCDEIFTERNFVNDFTWVNNLKGRQISGHGAAGTYESILCYAGDIDSAPILSASSQYLKGLMPNTYKGFDFQAKEDCKGLYITTNELYNSNSAFNEETRPNLVFDIWYRASDGDIQFDDPKDKSYTFIKPHSNSDGVHKYHAYRWSKKKILNERDDLEFVKSGDTFRIYTKRRDFDSVALKDVITDINTTMGKSDLDKVNPTKKFDHPKPLKLIQVLLKSLSTDNPIVLDFFAGSGTTGHAVMELNMEDDGHRQFILCTNNENRIAEDVTYPRIKNVINGYANVDGIPANVRYFRTDFVEKDETLDKLRRKLSPACEDMIRIREGSFEKVIDDDMLKVFRNSRGLTAVVFDRFELADYIVKIEELETDAPVHLYVFSYSKHDRLDELDGKLKHTYESQPIPEGVLEIYKRIFTSKGGRK